MLSTEELAMFRTFAALPDDFHIESTSAKKVTYTGVLYNVDGSTQDPKIDGKTWKKLLESFGIGGNCYVTNSGAGGSHPDFSVGGHVTPNSDGSVKTGGICYLMPLCYWHNGKGQDGVAFTHSNNTMLELSGYMQSELAATFLARMPSDEPYSIAFLRDGAWDNANLTEEKAAGILAKHLAATELGTGTQAYVLFQRETIDGRTMYRIVDSRLPEQGTDR
jgi:hypothetical protein